MVVPAFGRARVLGSRTSCTIPEQQDAAAAAQEKPSSQLCLLTAIPTLTIVLGIGGKCQQGDGCGGRGQEKGKTDD